MVLGTQALSARSALAELRARGSLLDNVSDGILAIDLEGQIIECNAVAREMFALADDGRSLQDLLQCCDIWREGTAQPIESGDGPLSRALRGMTTSHELQHLLHRRSGRSYWIVVQAFSLRAADAKIVGALSICRDVTDEHTSRTLALEREAHYGAVVRAIPDHILKLDREGTILAYKPGTVVGAELLPSNCIGRKLSELLPPAVWSRVETALGAAFEDGLTKTVQLEMSHGAELRSYEARLSPAHGRELIAIVRDITDQQRAERERELARKELASLTHLAHLSEMASMMAHELNQPLSAIGLDARGCQRRLVNEDYDVEGLQRALDRIVEQSHRAAEIIRRIRDYARRGFSGFEPADLGQIVERVANAARYEAQEQGVELSIRPLHGLPPLMLDRPQIQQAILQLVRNAIEASGQSREEHRRVRISAQHLAPEHCVMLSIEDTGPGISAQDADRIFDLFFTSKRSGVGLGLPIAKSIAEAHGGRIFVENTSSSGTTFCLRLPTALEGEAHAHGSA